MKKASAFAVGAVGLVACVACAACARDKGAETPSATSITSGSTGWSHPAATPEQVRATLLQRLPTFADEINKLVISTEDGVVILEGTVESEGLRLALLNQVRTIPNVRGFRDGMHVRPNEPMHQKRAKGAKP